jgi:hypothetical protein
MGSIFNHLGAKELQEFPNHMIGCRMFVPWLTRVGIGWLKTNMETLMEPHNWGGRCVFMVFSPVGSGNSVCSLYLAAVSGVDSFARSQNPD